MPAQPKKEPDDELTRQLRAAVRKKRRLITLPGLLLLMVLFGLPTSFFLWWFWPSPPPPRLGVIAFDQLALPDETVPLTAELWPEGGNWNRTSPRGWDLDFHPPGGPKGKTKSAANGLGVVPITTPGQEGIIRLEVRLAATRNQRGAVDEAKIYSLPAETSLLIVDVHDTLTSADKDDWRKKNLVDIPPVLDAVATLSQVKSRVVYLATIPESPLERRKVRSWVADHLGTQKPGLPPGPVLSLSRSGEKKDGEAARKEILGELAGRFKGPITAILGSVDAANLAKSLGMRAIYFGIGTAPQGVASARSWEEIKLLLKEVE